MLTAEQYDFLNQKRNEFETLVHQQYCRNLDHRFLSGMKDIHQSVLGGQPVNIACNACIQQAMCRLYPEMIAYEKFQREQEELIKNQKNIKRTGRQPKNWIG